MVTGPLSKSMETRRIEFAGRRDKILKDKRGKAKKKQKSTRNRVPRKFNVMLVQPSIRNGIVPDYPNFRNYFLFDQCKRMLIFKTLCANTCLAMRRNYGRHKNPANPKCQIWRKGIRLESGFYTRTGIRRSRRILQTRNEWYKTTTVIYASKRCIWIKNNNNNDKSRLTRIHIVLLYN